MSAGTILIIILFLLALGAFPGMGHSWGYGPSGILGVVLVIVLVLWLMGRV